MCMEGLFDIFSDRLQLATHGGKMLWRALRGPPIQISSMHIARLASNMANGGCIECVWSPPKGNRSACLLIMEGENHLEGVKR